MNMVLNKKHIILAALVLALGVAVYLNFVFADKNKLVEQGGLPADKNYGDAELVNDKDGENGGETGEEGQTVSASSYFEEARLSRTRARDEAIATLQQIFTDIDAGTEEGEEQAAEATMKALGIAQSIESESKIENLILAKGYDDCLVYITDTSADVVVKTDGLLANEVAVIKDIILSETNLAAENIKILEVK